MYDRFEVFIKYDTEPVLIEPLGVDIWVYNDLIDKTKAQIRPMSMMLTIAYCQLVDPSPATLDVVKKWAREERVQVKVVGPVDPTPLALIEDS